LTTLISLSNAYLVDTHGHKAGGTHAAHGPEGSNDQLPPTKESKMVFSDLEEQPTWTIDDSALAQIVGIAILEFGVTLHR
jgi:solute carrier family 39 (zinc transporter), member 1/2/3